MQLTAKTVLITGAGRGLGAAMAEGLAARGANLALLDLDAAGLDAVRTACEKRGVRAATYKANVAVEADVVTTFDRVVTDFGRLDAVIANAGILRDGLLVKVKDGAVVDKLPLAQWQAVIDVNLTGVFLCMQEAFRMMKSQEPRGGRIINNGSISAHAPRPNSAPYTATKHAITGLTKSGSLDGRKYDIACGQIDIGNAATELAARMAKGVPQASGQVAVEPLMDVGHVASAVLYMASLPLDANVQFMTIMATKMPFVGRG
jgi:NAD(P)-dependent dehydrogenase (short-subunit alcohol dehydrogenase family)